MESSSVIITTYNDKQQELKDSITSILHQENVDIELILVMVSDDVNLSMVTEWSKIINNSAKHCVCKLIVVPKNSHPGRSPKGSFHQINEGLKHVTKRWVRWFSGDDILYPRSTDKQIKSLLQSGKMVSYGGFTLLDAASNVTESVKFYPYSRALHQRTNFINDVALWDSELIKMLPFPYQRWDNYCFWDFWLRVYDKYGDVFEYLDQVLWAYRIRPESTHIRRVKEPGGKQDYDRFRRALQKNHPIKFVR